MRAEARAAGQLLRVIQNGEFVRVGGSRPIRTDVRLITATNKDPKRQVELGAFREDLYYRIAVFMIGYRRCASGARTSRCWSSTSWQSSRGSTTSRSPASTRAPCAGRWRCWPGNVRQLENVLEQAAVLADGDVLTERELFTQDGVVDPSLGAAATYEPGLPLREVERRHILRTLQKVKGNRTEAARLLRISLRSLQYKLKDYVADPNASREASL